MVPNLVGLGLIIIGACGSGFEKSLGLSLNLLMGDFDLDALETFPPWPGLC